MSSDARYTQALIEAKKINYRHGTSYFWATLLFPQEIRSAVHILYAFFRIPDEIVDQKRLDQSEALAAWFQRWQQAYLAGDSSEPILYATSKIFHQYQIPYHYSVSFFDAMRQDLVKTRYETYQDLEQYMYGSAAVVGLILSHVIGFKDTTALVEATQLGYAMQLTNFLRDIDEDFQERNRIYFPREELERFGITDQDIAQRNFSSNFSAFVDFQIKKARQLYTIADVGITKLDLRGQKAVRVASRLYAAILKKIEDQQGNIFLKRARTSMVEKLVIMLKTTL